MCGQPRLMFERRTRCLMSERRLKRLTFEQWTRCHSHSKVNVNQLLHVILDIDKLNGQSATRFDILA